VLVVSDSIGETAEQVARAAASQFDSGAVEIWRVPYVDDTASVEGAIRQVRDRRAAIVYTIVNPALRRVLQDAADRDGIPHVDVMGPAIRALSHVVDIEPRLQPGLVHRLDEEYFRRIEAVEFAVKYDDGKDPRGLLSADVVLIGVSRTSKTPVSMYLAHRRYRVANVPLMPEVTPPRELYELPGGKVIGLTICPEKLLEIRRERLKAIGLDSNAHYADMRRIREEIAFADRVFAELGCPVIDVSTKAVEETANTVLEHVREEDGDGES